MTLMELVVALGLLALLVATLAGALGVTVRGTAAMDARAAQGETMRIAQETLRRYLAQARPVRWRIGQREQVGFSGEAEALGFVAIMPPWPGEGGTYLVRLLLRESSYGKALVLQRQPTAGEQVGFGFGAGADETVLVDGVLASRFTYYGLDPGVRRMQWRTEWRAQPGLPKLVRLDLQLADPAAPPWPPLVVALPLEPEPR
jgi:type II secretory pathway pseudopilin PulG